jgi:hypothetical protein
MTLRTLLDAHSLLIPEQLRSKHFYLEWFTPECLREVAGINDPDF